MKTEQQTFYNVTFTTADSKEDQRPYISEAQYQKLSKENTAAGGTEVINKQQTFVITHSDNINEALEITPNEEVANSYYDYGLTLAQHNVKRDLMTDPDWAPIEGAYDLLADVQQPKERRVPDPLSASRKSLKALWAKLHPGAEPPTDDEINAVLASFAGAAAPTAA
jgi:hypothetical protein